MLNPKWDRVSYPIHTGMFKYLLKRYNYTSFFILLYWYQIKVGCRLQEFENWGRKQILFLSYSVILFVREGVDKRDGDSVKRFTCTYAYTCVCVCVCIRTDGRACATLKSGYLSPPCRNISTRINSVTYIYKRRFKWFDILSV